MPSVAGVAYVSIVPSLAGFQTKVKSELAGVNATVSVKFNVDRASKAKAQAEVDAWTAKLTASQNAQADATGAVRVAEEKLNEVRAQSSVKASALAAAEEKLAAAQRALGTAQRTTTTVTDELQKAQQRLQDVTTRNNSLVGKLSNSLDGLKKHQKTIDDLASKFTTLTGSLTRGYTSAVKFSAGIVAIGSAVPMVAQLGTSVAQLAGGLLLLPALGAAAGASMVALAVGLHGVTTALKDTNPKKYAQDLAKLAPAAQQVVKELRALKPDLIRPVQESLFQGLAADLHRIGTIDLPVIKTGLVGVASGWNAWIRQFAGFATNTRTVSDLAATFGYITAAEHTVAGAIQPILGGLRNIGVVGASFLPSLGVMISSVAQRFGAWTAQMRANGSLQAWIDDAINAFRSLLGIIGNLASIVTTVFHAANAAGGGLFGTVQALTGQVAAFLKSGDGQSALTTLFGTLQKIVAALRPALGVVLNALADGIKALAPVLPGVATALASILVSLAPLIPAAAQLAAAILPPIVAAVSALGPALPVVASAILAVVGALKAMAVIMPIVDVALAAFDIELDANPIVLIVAAIAAVVGALVYLQVKFNIFGKLWSAIWGGIKTAVSAVWNGFLKPVFDAIATAAKAIGEAFSWLWNTVLQPVFSVIGTAVRILAAIVYTVLVVPIYGLIKYVLAPVFVWLYNNVIKPIGEVIADAWKALWNVVQVIYATVVKPVFDALGAAFGWLYNNIIKPIGDAIHVVWDLLAAAFKWDYDNVIKPMFDAFGVVFHWLYDNIFRPIGDAISTAWHGLGTAFKWVYDTIIKPIADAIGTAIHGVGQVFQDVVNWIKSVWTTIEKIVGTPAKFVVDTVYNGAIVPVWNGIAGVFGLGPIHTVDTASWPSFATGGILPGYSPGVDNLVARGPSGPVALAGGEAIMRPEWTRAVGAGYIHGANAAAVSGGVTGAQRYIAENGIPGFSLGGIVGDIGNAIGSAASAVWKGLQTVGGWISQGVGAVVGEVTSLFGDATGKNNSAPGQSSSWKDAIKGILPHTITAVIDKIKSWFSSNAGSGQFGAGAIPTIQHKQIIDTALQADGIPAGQWGVWEAGLNTLIGRESGWNAAAINNWDSNAKAGHPSQGLMQTIPSTFAGNRNPALPNNILDPVANVAAGINYIVRRYGSITNVQQANASLPPKGYDAGGWLPPGLSTVYNGLGTPEAVLTPSQFQAVTSGTRGGDFTGNLYLDSGEFLGKVRGEIDSANGRTATAIRRGTRA